MIVSEQHFAYLRLQRGRIANLADGERSVWLDAYERSLQADYDSLKFAIPKTCSSVLDLGSGLGGIAIKLQARNGYGGATFNLVDGVADPPTMHLHRLTFSHREVALDFLAQNGVKKATYRSPEAFRTKPGGPYDLILSLGAWCFHTPPELFLGAVKAACHRSTIIILDVRKERQDWRRTLEDSFRFVGTALFKSKFDRLVFDAA